VKKLVIYGAQVPDTIKLIESINDNKPEWEIYGFIDDRTERQGVSFMGYPVLGTVKIVSELVKNDDIYFFVTHCSKPYNFKKNVDTLKSYNCKFANLIHPSVNLKYVKIGHGCQISEGCTVGANVEIGNFVTIRLKALICHDARIEDYSMICPNATVGSVAVIKQGSFIGTSATVLRTKTVGEWSTVGAGAVVVKDVVKNITVVGVPAKELKISLFKRISKFLKRQYKKYVFKEVLTRNISFQQKSKC